MNGIKRKKHMENPKTIGNVNVLNLVNATQESASGIQRIGNINFALVTPETAPLLQRISVGNINASVEIPSGSNLVSQIGQFLVNADFFKNVERKIFFLITGQLIVEPGVPAEEIEKSLAGLAVTGQFFCPEGLMGAFNAKSYHVTGQSIAYPPFKHVFINSLTLDPGFLNGLEDGAEISLLGGLSVPKVLANDLLERKIGKMYVSGEILCHEENAQAIRARLYKSPASFKTIPAGFILVEKPLVIDNDTLEYLPGAKLFCKELVRITAGVDPRAFDQRVEQLIAEDVLLCPSSLKPVLAPKCNLFETKAIFYQDELWLVQDEQTFRNASFDGLRDRAGTATLVVTGELTLDPAIPPATLTERLSKIHNFGLIRCAPEQHDAINSRLSTREGQIEDVLPVQEQPQEEEPRKDYIGNVNYLVL
jgi:hypothetical protein